MSYRFGEEYTTVVARPATRREAEIIKMNLAMQGVDVHIAVHDSDEGVNLSAPTERADEVRRLIAELGYPTISAADAAKGSDVYTLTVFESFSADEANSIKASLQVMGYESAVLDGDVLVRPEDEEAVRKILAQLT